MNIDQVIDRLPLEQRQKLEEHQKLDPVRAWLEWLYMEEGFSARTLSRDELLEAAKDFANQSDEIKRMFEGD